MTDKPVEPAAENPVVDAKPATGDTVHDEVDAKSEVAVADTTAPGSSGPQSELVRAPADSAPDSTTGPVAEQAGEAGGTVSVKKLPGEFAGSGPEAGPDRQGGGSRPRALLAALAVAVLLLIGSVGVAGYLLVQERDKAEMLAAHDEVRQAACRYAPVLANYDAKNLEPYFSAVLAGATGDWKKEFETTTTELREALAAGQVVSTAGDIQCAVKSADTTSAEVVVVIGQTITSLGTKGQPAPGQLAMVMRMQKTGDRWLVDQMTSPLATPLP